MMATSSSAMMEQASALKSTGPYSLRPVPSKRGLPHRLPLLPLLPLSLQLLLPGRERAPAPAPAPLELELELELPQLRPRLPLPESSW